MIRKLNIKRQGKNPTKSDSDLLPRVTNYTTIIGTIISLFFALYAIKLSIQQSKDRSQLNKLQQLVENVQKEDSVLLNILVHTKEEKI
jgi:hypothetical protein